MKKIIIATILISAAAVIESGCSSFPSCCVISPPRVSLTGDKTIIERQIVGDYKELEKDAWAVSSSKTTVSGTDTGSTVSAADPEIFRAMKIREYNDEKIRGYKNDGALGETNSGYVQYISADKYQADKEGREAINRLIVEENSARRLIFTRTLMNMNKIAPSADHIDAFGKLFAEEQRAAARKNDWVQDKSGRWIKK